MNVQKNIISANRLTTNDLMGLFLFYLNYLQPDYKARLWLCLYAPTQLVYIEYLLRSLADESRMSGAGYAG